jgi:membrane protein implicated in regulation of membrane protease activity
MSNAKNGLWPDIVFIVVGVLTTVLLFMPKHYVEYRYAGYAGVGIFAIFMVWRELRRRREKKEKE